jgi:hypothetical protein
VHPFGLPRFPCADEVEPAVFDGYPTPLPASGCLQNFQRAHDPERAQIQVATRRLDRVADPLSLRVEFDAKWRAEDYLASDSVD